MKILSPTVTAEDVAAATAQRSFTSSSPVEAGEYEMVVKTAPLVKTSKAGNAYLQLMLTHTGDIAKGATAVYPNFNLNEVGQSQFTQLLLALGFSADSVAGAGWGIASEEADDKGRRQAVIAINGDAIDLQGRSLKVYLTKKDSKFNGRTTTRNEVGRFIISN